jgi:hypothetical protein
LRTASGQGEHGSGGGDVSGDVSHVVGGYWCLRADGV